MNGGNETSWPWYWRSQQDGQHDQIKRNGIDINDGLKRNGRRTYSHWRLGNRSSDVRELSLILLLLRKSRLRLTRPLKALASMCWMSFFDKYLSGDNQIYSTATLFSLLFSLFIYLFLFFSIWTRQNEEGDVQEAQELLVAEHFSRDRLHVVLLQVSAFSRWLTSKKPIRKMRRWRSLNSILALFPEKCSGWTRSGRYPICCCWLKFWNRKPMVHCYWLSSVVCDRIH